MLLARVTQTKGKGDVQYVGIATGMNSLIRPALYGAYHDIVNLTRLGKPATGLVTSSARSARPAIGSAPIGCCRPRRRTTCC